MKRKIFLLSLLLLGTWIVRADEPVRFTASAPSAVVLDKPFQLVFSVNASGRDMRAPEINNFDILAGPFESSSQSYQMINGRTTSSVSVSYTYTLQAQKTGTFTIPSASIVVGGQKYTSNGVSIKVLPADATPPSKSQGGRSGSPSSSSQSISGDNIFIKTNVSKTNVYEQEAILVTYKLYTLVDVVQCAPKKMIDFNGFLKQDLEQSKNKQSSLENFNGRNYITAVLYQVLLYPQHSGILQIDKWDFEAVVQVKNRVAAHSIFDDFFDSYTNITKHIVAPAARIIVNKLPANKPASFNGTVGHFTMNSILSSNKVKTNDAVTLKINIAGTGNMKLIKNPEIKFPNGLETYDPKVVNNFKTSSFGVSGSKSIEYMFIPRHSGNFEIPSAEFTYFDTQTKTYKVLRTPVYTMQIEKGEGGESTTVAGTSYVDKEDVKQLGKDIRYIQTDNIELSKENANMDFVRNKKANKVAQKRLKLAQKLLHAGNKEKFYEEVMKAVWTYLSDKLSISVAELTKDKVEHELTKRGVNDSVINQFIQILNTCEYARYAPNTGQHEMGNLYSETISAISELEGLVKKS